MSLENISPARLRRIFRVFNRFMVLIWRLGLGSYGNGTRFGGSVMVIKNIGRISGKMRYTPVNYAVVDGEIYCTAGFGQTSDWYRNLLVNPNVELWLPDGYWAGMAEDASEHEERASLLRQVIIASGFAGPLFGVNQKRLSDEDLTCLLKDYRLLRIHRTKMLTGPGGPGDLAWIWPMSTVLLLGLLLRPVQRRKRNGRVLNEPG